MAETEGYNGAFTGAQIDAAIAAMQTSTVEVVPVTLRLSNVRLVYDNGNGLVEETIKGANNDAVYNIKKGSTVVGIATISNVDASGSTASCSGDAVELYKSTSGSYARGAFYVFGTAFCEMTFNASGGGSSDL